MSRCRRRSDPTLGAFLMLALMLGCFFAYPVASFTVLGLGIAAVCVVASRRRAAEAERKRLAAAGWDRYMRERSRPVPGADWCDHCAEWTVHETAQHARV